MDNKERIARKIAFDIEDGVFINFGHGIPFSVPQYIAQDKKVLVENEAGIVSFGVGKPAPKGVYDYLDVSNSFVSELPTGAYLLDSVNSFAMIRGGHVDITVLGAMQVDEHASIANWKVPGKPASGIGGAMDLCAGCKEVWAAMESTTKDGDPKLVKDCSYPLTAKGKVTRVYTEFGLVLVNPEDGFRLIEIFTDYTQEDIRELVGAEIKIDDGLRQFDPAILEP